MNNLTFSAHHCTVPARIPTSVRYREALGPLWDVNATLNKRMTAETTESVNWVQNDIHPYLVMARVARVRAFLAASPMRSGVIWGISGADGA